MDRTVTASAHARAGLLGNPSDQYQGKAVAVCLSEFTARVTLVAAEHFAIVPGEAEALRFDDLRGQLASLRERGCDDGIRLLRAALLRFAAAHPALAELPASDPRLRFELRFETDVPRQAGLAGSSAIVVAALRALADWFDLHLEPFPLSELALAAELEDLGIAAGPMDRAIQAYEGCLWMDFREPRGPHSYRRLDPGLLPPLFVAWDPRGGRSSGAVHGGVRARWERGDPDVRRAMQVFPALAERGLGCLESGDPAGFRRCVDENFDTRAAIFDLSERDHELVRLARGLGAAAKLAGSGGAVVGVPLRESDLTQLAAAYTAAGYCMLRPRVRPDSG